MKTRIIIIILFLIQSSLHVFGQLADHIFMKSPWENHKWEGQWIAHSEVSLYDYSVQLLRKEIELPTLPNSFIVHLSADQRYEFFVNGKSIAVGPANGGIMGWNYDTFDLTPYLQKGKNILAAKVVNYGKWTPGAQQTLSTGFILQGESETEKIANSNGSWKVFLNTAYTPSLVAMAMLDIEPSDQIQGELYPWGWEQLSYDDRAWTAASGTGRGNAKNGSTEYRRALQPRTIPMPEVKPEPPMIIRRSTMQLSDKRFLDGKKLQIPKQTQVKILLDQGYLTNAFVEFNVSGGDGASIGLTYSESLYDEKRDKGNRNDIEGKEIYGNKDVFFLEGGNNRIYKPLNFKTFRYVEVEIQTNDQPLTLNALKQSFVGYPFELKASFNSSNNKLKEIFDVGWHTARLCAVDTYYDCPYYERLQYTGDTRIQGLISLYMSGDDRLMRKAIDDLASSLMPEGILQSRFPSHHVQIIPPFSLYWINMLHDYWMHRPDEEFVKKYLPTAMRILEWYDARVDQTTGMLGQMPHWNFTDWPNEWPWSEEKPLGGVPPGAIEGGSSILSLQYSYTLKDAEELFSYFNNNHEADFYAQRRKNLNDAVLSLCFDESRGLMADDAKRSSYSQHANIMGILSDAIPQPRQVSVFNRLNSDKSLIQATVYYRFYLTRAMKKVNLANQYVQNLDIWTDMLGMGLTTFAERPEPSRSDCHAWSASPTYDFLSTVCGIQPLKPGFQQILVKPNLGDLAFAKGKMPHPKGMIEVDFKQKNNQYEGTITLPQDVKGEYVHHQKLVLLYPGVNYIK